MPLDQAALYEQPFEYVRRVIYPERMNRNEKRQRDYWWLHARPSPRYRAALKRLRRYIATSQVAKHRVFAWLDSSILADHTIIVFARDDDYFFGVLHSRFHELWALRMGTSLEDRPRYTPTSTSRRSRSPGRRAGAGGEARVAAIAAAARIWCCCGIGGWRGTRADVDGAVQRAADVAGGGARAAGRGGGGGLRLAGGSAGRGGAGAAAGAERGKGGAADPPAGPISPKSV